MNKWFIATLKRFIVRFPLICTDTASKTLPVPILNDFCTIVYCVHYMGFTKNLLLKSILLCTSIWVRKKEKKVKNSMKKYCIKICFITVRCAHLKSNQYWINWQYQKHFTAKEKEKYKRIDTGSWKHHWLLTLRECHCASGEKMLFTKMRKGGCHS